MQSNYNCSYEFSNKVYSQSRPTSKCANAANDNKNNTACNNKTNNDFNTNHNKQSQGADNNSMNKDRNEYSSYSNAREKTLSAFNTLKENG